MSQGTHESYRREEAAAPGTERAFGFVMAGACAIIAGINYWHAGQWWPWLAGVGAAFLAAAFLFPAMLKPLNVIWFKFGLLLHKIVNPLIMGLLFFVTVWPTGLVMRALGRDLLRLKRDPDAGSYWIVRQPPGPLPGSMKDQF